MADHQLPTLTSTYSNFVSQMSGRFNDIALGLDPATTTATNVPTNSIRWNSVGTKWEKYNGTAWNDLATTYTISISGNSATVTNGVYTTGSYSNPGWISALAGSKITGAISGNSGSATKLETARNINGVAFDGTAAISINLNNSLTFNNGGSGVASGGTFNGGSAVTVSYNSVGAPSTTGTGASGTWGINITGNAATVTNGVYNTGSQDVGGVKTFTDSPVIRNSSPTLYFRDTDNMSAMLLCNSNLFYVLRGGTDTTTWTQVNGQWPLTIDLSNNDATCGGNFTAIGNVTAYSDERLKTNWQPLPHDFLTRFATVKHGVYNRTDTGAIQVGVSAQSLREVMPEAVKEDDSGMLSVSYGNAALAACVALAKEVMSLRDEIRALKHELEK